MGEDRRGEERRGGNKYSVKFGCQSQYMFHKSVMHIKYDVT